MYFIVSHFYHEPPAREIGQKCAVSCDGTWQRRGFSFSNGCVTAISMDTGKVLDVEPLSKVCKKCREHAYLLLLGRETQAFVLRMLWRW